MNHSQRSCNKRERVKFSSQCKWRWGKVVAGSCSTGDRTVAGHRTRQQKEGETAFSSFRPGKGFGSNKYKSATWTTRYKIPDKSLASCKHFQHIRSASQLSPAWGWAKRTIQEVFSIKAQNRGNEQDAVPKTPCLQTTHRHFFQLKKENEVFCFVF